MTIPRVPIEKVNKMPLAYALMIVGGLLGIFITKFLDKNTEVIATYKESNKILEARNAYLIKNCDSVARFWQGKYVGSLERAAELQRIKDSTNSAILHKPNMELIKAIKNKRR